MKFALDDGDHSLVWIKIVDGQIQRFRDAHPCAGEKPEKGCMGVGTDTIGGGELAAGSEELRYFFFSINVGRDSAIGWSEHTFRRDFGLRNRQLQVSGEPADYVEPPRMIYPTAGRHLRPLKGDIHAGRSIVSHLFRIPGKAE